MPYVTPREPMGARVAMQPAGFPWGRYMAPVPPADYVGLGALGQGYHLVSGEAELIALMQQRMENPHDLALRDAEHEAFSRLMLRKLGPVLGRAVVATSVPVYTAGKLFVKSVGGMKGATPPSVREIVAGLRPLWITEYQTFGVWPGARLATMAQCQAYLKSHGGGAGSG